MPNLQSAGQTTTPVFIIHDPAGETFASTGINNNATGFATLSAVPGKTLYTTGFTIDGLGATVGSSLIATITGLGGSYQIIVNVPTGVTTPLGRIYTAFPRPLPASAVNTSRLLTVPAFGAGNTVAIGIIHGFAQS